MPFLALLAGPMGRIALYVALALAASGAIWGAIHEHDKRILAEQAAREAVAVADQKLADAHAAVAAVQAEADAAVARAQAASSIKQEIARAPASVACIASEPVRTALRGLRIANRAGDGAPGNPAGAAAVPSTTGAARTAPR